MPNGSLDKIIRESQLAWCSIFRIIEGIAQGVHYLHEEHVVHMDVKPSNILLDSNMNPKITDFNISMVLHDGEITGDDILGTLGYIPPECYENSTISMMNDVYAFGVTVINIISVMCRNIQPYERLLCTWAWDAWEAGQMEEVFDPKLYEGSQPREIKRCVEVGLLCLQSDRADRPTMADVLEMLHGKKRLPTLKKPAYMESESESEIESVTEGRSRNRWNRTRNRKSLRKAAHSRR
ncbi:cysteine-rich receptor-like protein kinase 10 isoform X2 [Panicum virgatum]|uniref:cysteine-rich receptor-like protein kinase 10 isoform X2 n=1 Tax=Panicum virgatum TaxID=38727 RepID=UPI0019D5050B|nr:cysteine-rich receptor-like protein kinase 10 isoform X2 [Panicum virgatum]